MGDITYLSVTYQKYGYSDIDTERSIFGLGAKYSVNKYLAPFGQLHYVYVKSKASGISLLSSKQWRPGIGVFGEYYKTQYKVGVARYYVEGDVIKDETVPLASSYQ